jgi:SSS family solute:Na+ symporter
VVITLLNLVHPWPDRLWWDWGLVGIYLAIILTPLTTIWFTWGALRDLRRFFATLRVRRVDERDDGRVIDHRNADDAPADVPASCGSGPRA